MLRLRARNRPGGEHRDGSSNSRISLEQLGKLAVEGTEITGVLLGAGIPPVSAGIRMAHRSGLAGDRLDGGRSVRAVGRQTIGIHAVGILAIEFGTVGVRVVGFGAVGMRVGGVRGGLLRPAHPGEQPDLFRGPLGLMTIKPGRQGRDLALGLLGLGAGHRQPGGELRGASLGLGELRPQLRGLSRECLNGLGIRRHGITRLLGLGRPGLVQFLGLRESSLEHLHSAAGHGGLPLSGGDPLLGLSRLLLGGCQSGRERGLLQRPLVLLAL